jgi:hypothetical protein
VNISTLLKELKKRLRWKRGWLSLGSIVLLTAAVWLATTIGQDKPANIPTITLNHLLFEEPMEEVIKENTYFGLDDNGILSLFEGLPSDKKVIRSFFQLDVKHLESSLPRETIEQLYEGIKVTDLAEYNSVLSTFSDFATDISEEVMEPYR